MPCTFPISFETITATTRQRDGNDRRVKWRIAVSYSNEHGNVKECDGTHSERSARRVPTLRNQRKHRIGATKEDFGER